MDDDFSQKDEDGVKVGADPDLHRRRPRYSGTHPRKFDEKYKELNPQIDPETVAKVMASGKTPAGMHRSIMVAEVIAALDPRPGDVAVDATLGWGGNAREIIPLLQPGGRLIGLDCDPVEQPRTVERLQSSGFGSDVFVGVRSNFSGLPKVLATPRPGRCRLRAGRPGPVVHAD